jgi:nucleoid DNA-binding protein
MALTKKKIIRRLAADVGCTQKKASEILCALLNAIESTLAEGKFITLRGFGKFYLSSQRPRTIRHPLTGECYKLKRKNIVKFRCSKVIEDDLNIIEWNCDDPWNRKILQEIYDLIERAELEEEDEDELMYYPGKIVKYHLDTSRLSF